VLLGGLFCLPDGFSYTALRLSTLLMGVAGAAAMAGCARACGLGRATAALAACLAFANPLYLNLSLTVMTDIHAFAWSAL
jgi:dolichyl-phosphate-mannose--protein O-mannosyl transferase